MKNTVYFAEKINQRCLIKIVDTSGQCVIKCQDNTYKKAMIGDLKRVQ